MSILDSIVNFQKAPQRKRVAVLMVSVTLAMAAIIGIWVMQLSYQFAPKQEAKNDTASFSQPFRDLFSPIAAKVKTLYEKRTQ